MLEVYTLNTALITLFLFLVFYSYRKKNYWPLYLAFFIGGMGTGNHVLMGLYVFAFITILFLLVFRDHRIGWLRALTILGAYIAGASLYGTLFVLHWINVYKTVRNNTDIAVLAAAFQSLCESLRYATGGDFLKLMFNQGLSFREQLFWRGNYFLLIFLNFPSAAIVFIVTGFGA